MMNESDHGGIRCSEVLEALPSIVDGDAPSQTTAQVEAHLGECANCATFAADYASLLGLLQLTQPAEESPVERSASHRCAQRVIDAIEE